MVSRTTAPGVWYAQMMAEGGMPSQYVRDVLCPTCGALLEERAKFCAQCGAPAYVACPGCGHASSARANFCAECGTRLVRASESGVAPAKAQAELPDDGSAVERRQLTVLFCDLVGSTALSSRLDPEDLREIIGTYHRCVAETVARFDGFVARFMGDGALVYFGYPKAYEDNAERALRAALALVSNVAKLAVRDERLSARIGIATGLVIVGELINAGAARELTALGQTPNLAARLQALAEPGAIVLAEDTKRLVDGAFEYRDLGAITLKGFEAPVHAWQVVGEERIKGRLAAVDSQPETPGVRASQVPLVGRQQELGLLRKQWEQVVEGYGRVVLLTGDAGIGKSRLVQMLIASIGQASHYEVEFHCSAYYAHSPLYPVIDMLPRVLGWRRIDSDEVKLDKLQAFCARLGLPSEESVPLLASLLSLPASGFPLSPMSPERQKQRTLETLLAATLALAGERPLLMVVEDLHWMDPTTMELLAMLTEQAPTVRVFALFTGRPEFKPPWPPHSHVVPCMLTRLTRRQTEELAQHVAGGKPLPTEVVEQIVARTDGVPLFVEELTKTVLESGLVAEREDGHQVADPLAGLAIPTTLQDSLTARLDRLTTARPVAQMGATLGREFAYVTLQAVVDLDSVTLQRELDRLVDAEFLYQRGAPPDATYTFKHALIQEAAYQSLLKATRQKYHARIAKVMVEQFADEAEIRPEFVAMHWTEGGSFEEAIRWRQKAAQRAFQRASYLEAIAHYTKGLAVLESLPGSEGRDQSELSLQVELGYALIPVRGWSAPDSAQAFMRAGELCRRISDTSKLFRALWGLGAFHFVHGAQVQARQIADQCLSVAASIDDLDARIEAHYLSGIVASVMGDFASGQRQLEECIGLYGAEERKAHRILYGQDGKASALGWLAMGLWTLGYPDAALERAQEALARVRDAAQPFLLARGLAAVGFVHVFRGEPQGPDSPLLAALALCTEQGFTYFRAVVAAFHGANLALLGKTDEGVEMMLTSIAGLRTIGSELLFTIIHGHLASAHLALRQVEPGLAAVAAGLECVQRNAERWAEAELHRLRGELLLVSGQSDADRADASFRTALEIAGRQRARSYQLRAARSLARLRCQQGNATEAKTALAEALGAWPENADTPDLRDARQLRQQLG